MLWDDEGALVEYDGPHWSIWGEMKDLVQLWYDTYAEYWGVNGNARPTEFTDVQWKNYQQADRLAELMLQIVEALNIFGVAKQNPSAISFTRDQLRAIRASLRTQSKSGLIKDRISLEIARQVTRQVDGASDRALKLLGLVRGQGLSVRASAFISRATKLYLWGFDPEAAIMCRAALQAALLERLEPVLDQDRAEPNLDALVRLAGQRGVLEGYEETDTNRAGWRARTDTPLWRAQRLKWIGNFAAHEAPAFDPEVEGIPTGFEAIRELSAVLGFLFPPPTFE
jgi:hypothetical protein